MDEKNSNNLDKKTKERKSLERVGNFIKEARLSRNLSTAELASNLKIGEHQLKAIEDGRDDLLPEIVFIKAMIRRIAEKLNLDRDFIINELSSERKEVKIEEIVKEVSKKVENNKQAKDQNHIGFGIFILISGIFGLLASSITFNIFSDYLHNQTPKEELIKNN